MEIKIHSVKKIPGCLIDWLANFSYIVGLIYQVDLL